MRIDRKCVRADTETQLFFLIAVAVKLLSAGKTAARWEKTIHALYITMQTHLMHLFKAETIIQWINLFFTVITATLISAAMRDQSILATFSILHLYKEGSLAIQQAGKTMSTKVTVLCKSCPLVRRGKCLYINFDKNPDYLNKTQYPVSQADA